MPLKDDWDTGDQFTADDANDVADAVNAAYVKPVDGIPKADFTAAVQVSLGKADTAVQAVDAATISDSTSTGRSVLTAVDSAAARTALGVTYGTAAGTVAQGNDSRFSPNAAAITDSTAVGRSVLTAVDAAGARSAIGVSYGTTVGTVVQGNDSRITVAIKRSIQTVTTETTLGANAATDYVILSNITPDVNTVSMLHLDGANGSTTITDTAAGTPSAWTAIGGSLSTAQKKFGTASYTGGLILPTTATNFTFGTGDFSVELWLRTPSSTSNGSFVFDFRADGAHNSLAPALYITSNQLRYLVDGTVRITGGTTLSANTWYHVALCRVSGTTTLYLNGSSEGTWSDSSNYICGTARPIFLRAAADTGGAYYSAHIDEIRVAKGGAAYSANFTPPSAAFPDNGSEVSPITLPTAVGNTNLYTIMNINSGVLPITSLPGQTIGGASSISLSQNSVVRLISNGSNWFSI